MGNGAMNGNNPSGRPPVHGARKLERLYREGTLDGRTWEARRMQEHIDGLVSQHGGVEELGYSDLLTIQRAAFRATFCELIEAHCLREWNAGKLPVDPGKDYDSKANGLRRDCDSLRESLRLRLERGKGGPSLEDYIRARAEAAANAPAAPVGAASAPVQAPASTGTGDAPGGDE